MKPAATLVLVAALALAGCGPPPCRSSYTAPLRPARPFLSETRADDGGVVTVFGTWHAAGEGDVPAAAWAALEAADVVVLEVDVPEGETLTRSLELPVGESLPKLLPADDWYELQTLLPDARGLERPKPWIAMSMLTRRAYAFPVTTMDDALRARAERLGKRIEFLETWDEQVAALDASVGAAALSQTIRAYPTIRCELTDSLAAYRAGDVARILSARGHEHEVLVAARNRRWAPKIEALRREHRKVFVAVGVDHVVGEDALVAPFARLPGIELARAR